MGLPNKSKKHSNKKPNGSKKGDRKKVKYVYLISKKAVFLVTGEPRKSKYSYGVQIIPLQGLYYSSKDERTYTAKELANYYVVLNVKRKDADVLRDKKIVVMGYNENETLFVPANKGGKNGNNKA